MPDPECIEARIDGVSAELQARLLIVGDELIIDLRERRDGETFVERPVGNDLASDIAALRAIRQIIPLLRLTEIEGGAL